MKVLFRGHELSRDIWGLCGDASDIATSHVCNYAILIADFMKLK